MSKITFRADDDLVTQLEEFDASKSEVMREALRAYLDDPDASSTPREAPVNAGPDSLDDLIAARVDDLITERIDAAIDERLDARRPRQPDQDLNVNISLDGAPAQSQGRVEERKTNPTDAGDESDTASPCAQCGEQLSSDDVYCPNCGEKSARRIFCDCGDELRSDWAFCPSCGRRTPAADVLDSA
jgi:Arc/MetJ-type ribon-helix-helix transcriptional regulator